MRRVRAALPQGVVTFLFTDVAGSTRLWEQAPEVMGAAMARHDALVEAAVADRGGVLVRPRGEGDSRFAVFSRASAAVAAALDVQRALAAEPWPTPQPVRVRTALHTGEADLRDGDYYGRSVNRCARLRGLGHPDQVLLSQATADLVVDALPDGARLQPLGAHALPDLLRPEHVFQLLAPGLPARFPPLRSGPPPLDVRVLGPVEAERDGTALPLGSPPRRAVLARLALEPGRVVSRDELVRAGWGPDGSGAALSAQLAALRRALAPGHGPSRVLVARPPGYVLQVPPGSVDVQRFEVLVTDAQKELADGRFETAARGLSDALALWRGSPAEGTPLEGAPATARLAALRLDATEDLYEAELGCGRHAAVLDPLQTLLAVAPDRERLWGQLALALHRHGARGAALDTLDRAARVLPAGPGPELLDLGRRLRAQDPSLGGPPGTLRPGVQLPSPPGALHGREDDVAALLERLDRPGTRLLTLTGPGGAGKTRLAVEVAHRVAAHGRTDVLFVPLAGVLDPAAVLPAVAALLQVTGAPGQPLVTALAVALDGALLVLDNLEQVGGAGEVVVDLLAAAPALRVLASSRSALRVQGELEHPVDPLALPPEGATLEQARQSPAVALFVARAQSVRPTFDLDERTGDDVVEICRRLDGLPLALELAAARVGLLTPSELLARLDSQLRVLVGGARDLPDRQRTLRATIDWSHALLAPGPARLLARLGVFAGEFGLAEAEAVGDVEDVLGDLDDLVQGSLVRRTVRGDEGRFRLLGSVREYALERLRDLGEDDAARGRLADLLVDRVEAAVAGLDGPQAADLLADLHARSRDLIASLGWLLDHGHAEAAARLAVGLRTWWLLEGRLTEGRTWLARVQQAGTSPGVGACALLASGVLAYFQDDPDRAAEQLRQARDLATQERDEATAATALGYLAAVGLRDGLVDEAQRAAEQVLGTAVRLDLYEAHTLALSLSAVVAALRGDVAAERELYGRRLRLCRARADCRRIAETLNNLAEIALLEGDPLAARTAAEEALDLARGVARLVTRDVLLTLARVELADGASGRAAVHVEQALRLSVDLGQEFEVAQGLLVAAAVATSTGDHDRAARLFGAGTRLRGERSPLELDLEPDVAARRDRTRDLLGEQAFSAAGREGAELPRARALDLALSAQPTR